MSAQSPFDYAAAWQQVDTLLKQDLTRSALTQIETIQAVARREAQDPQLIKALLSGWNLQRRIEEKSDSLLVNRLQGEIAQSEQPNQAILQSYLADLLYQYYEDRRWQIMDRTATEVLPTDFQTWDIATFQREIAALYLASVEPAFLLQSLPVRSYSVILEEEDQSDIFRPSLYDLLANRAIDRLSDADFYLNEPEFVFRISPEKGFLPALGFVESFFPTRDSAALSWLNLRLYQKLTGHHLESGNEAALVDVELDRLKFVKDQVNTDDKETRYRAALDQLAIDFDNKPALGEILLALAQWYKDQANRVPDQPRSEVYLEAERLCKQIIRKFPKTRAAENAAALLSQIEQKQLSMQAEAHWVPNEPSRIRVDYRNVNRVYFRVIRYTEEIQATLKSFSYSQEAEKYEYLRRRTVQRSWSQSLPAYADHHTHSTEIKTDGLSAGKYLVLASDHSSFQYQGHAVGHIILNSSSMAFVEQATGDGGRDIWVVDRKSGEPLPGLSVQTLLWDRYNNQKASIDWEGKGVSKLTTDATGKFTLTQTDSRNNSWLLRVQRGRESMEHQTGYSYRYSNSGKISTSAKTVFFTDRSIYRPGQIIYFKAIAMEQTGDQHRILTNQKMEVVFKDVNRQLISQQTFTTNEYGSLQGSFVAPTSGLTGQMSLSTSGGSVYVSVEEYKRPTFEVNTDPIAGAVKLGDEISLSGKAESFAGAAIGGAEVRYRVERRASFPNFWRWWAPPQVQQGQEIAHGSVSTEEDGSFSFAFVAQADESIAPKDLPVFTYQVSIDVVDISGETRSTQTSFRLGYQPIEIGLEVPGYVEKSEQVIFQLSSNNLNGEFVPTEGVISISPLETPEVNYRPRPWDQVDQPLYSEATFHRWFPRDQFGEEANPRNWEVGESILEVDFNTGDSTTLLVEAVQSLPPGRYQVGMKTASGLSIQRNFTLYNNYRKQLPVSIWLDAELSQERAEPGETVSLQLTTSEPHLWVLYQLIQQDRILHQEMRKIGYGRTEINIPITETHRGNLHLSLTYASQNTSQTISKTIRVPWTNRELSLKWESFRSPLQPGQQEQWKLRISGPKAEAVAAEMVATLYDASLDEFRPHQFSLNLNPTYGQYLRTETGPFGTNNDRLSGKDWNETSPTKEQTYDELASFGLALGRRSRNYGGGLFLAESAAAPRMAMAKSSAPGAPEPMAEAVESDSDGVPDLYDKEPETPQAEPKAPSPSIRTNLQETAFFFPQLQTNAEGEIVLNFTMPEALTRWKFLGLAHTTDLKTGTLGGETVTQKELMAVPNLPRFFREQDRVVLSGKMVNLTEGVLTGTARLELIDAQTEQSVDAAFGNNNNSQSFSVNGKGSTALQWEVQVPEGVDVVAVRLIASAGAFSDGEEQILPVLKNRMLVTESKPLTIRGKKKQTFTFDRLAEASASPTLQQHQLTLEITSNPAWEAIRSLPYLMEFPHECTEQIFSRFYANALGSHVANSDPRIQTVFEQWKALPDEAGFASKLQQNESLKNALLTETPWVVEAKSQAERQKRMGVLFDLERMQGELSRSQRQIRQRQNSDGGFSWFPGMPNSAYITQLIATGFGHLQKLGVGVVGDPENQAMLSKAVQYVDRIRSQEYEKLQASGQDLDSDLLSASAVQYLYMRSFYQDVPLEAKAQATFDFHLSQARNHWPKQSTYLKGMLSLVFHRYEEQALAGQVLAALKENAIYSEEMGMYWKTTRGYYWYEAPIETQALLMEAFQEVGGNIDLIEEQKVWLLQHKRTNDWGTTRATVAACNALLLNGASILNESEPMEIRLGGQEIEIPNTAEVGTGHFQVKWSASEIKPEMAELQIRRKDKSLAFGAMYWQYFEQLDKITTAQTPLNLQKSLWKETLTDRGPELKQITEQSPLHPGDKVVVRIELRVDRDMEYVHLKDMRAAGLEPLDVLSSYRYEGGLGFYQSTRDAGTHFFMDRLPKGTWVLEYGLRVTLAGDFSNGITTLQCMYAPEFSSHSAGIRLTVEE